MRTRPVIGLTGGIGAGKSTVARILRELGCVVGDADAWARQALRDDTIRETLVRWWGPDILDSSGQIDRRAVARIVFSRPGERARLESLVHPWIEARRRALFRQAPPEAPALVIDAPLLLEAGLDDECDVVIFVAADRTSRLARLADARGWGEDELLKREESQLALDEKKARSDYVLSNNGDLDTLTGQVGRTLTEILGAHRQ